jgi:hypothetical protein
MRKILLTIGFLVLSFFCVNLFAQPLPSTETFDELKTELTIYSLIAGVYALYWLKQRA